MASKHGYLQLMVAFALGSTLILSGCQDSGQADIRLAKGNGGTSGSQGKKTSEKYTPEQKKYLTTVTDLEAYKKHLAPLITKLSQEKTAPWTSLIALKPWLMTPQKLNAEDSRVMSVHLMDEGVEALTIQTNDDIWVKAELFKTLTTQEQADLLIDEALTSLYLLRNLDDQELCTLVQAAGAKSCKISSPATADASVEDQEHQEIEPGEDTEGVSEMSLVSKPKVRQTENTRKPISRREKKRLVEIDYRRIRLAKEYLAGDLDFTQKKVAEKLIDIGFDKRIFTVEFK